MNFNMKADIELYVGASIGALNLKKLRKLTKAFIFESIKTVVNRSHELKYLENTWRHIMKFISSSFSSLQNITYYF